MILTPRERRLGVGDCQKIGWRFLIRLSRRRWQQRALVVETLIHEVGARDQLAALRGA